MTPDIPAPAASADIITTLDLILNARRSLAEARSLPDVHRVIEAAAVLADAAQRAARLAEAQSVAADIVSAAIDAANDAVAIRIEAQARAGEILNRLREDGQIAGRGRPQKRSTASTFSAGEGAAPTSLDELGISKNDSSLWQRVAAVPVDVRRDYVEHAKAAKRVGSTTGLLRHTETRTADAAGGSIDHAAIAAEARKRMRAAYHGLVALPGYRPEALIAALDRPERLRLLRALGRLADWIEEARRELAVHRVTNEEG
jgi:hypothetical protein